MSKHIVKYEWAQTECEKWENSNISINNIINVFRINVGSILKF